MLTIKIIQASNPIALHNFIEAVRGSKGVYTSNYKENEDGVSLEIAAPYLRALDIAYRVRSMATTVYNHEIEIEFREVF